MRLARIRNLTRFCIFLRPPRVRAPILFEKTRVQLRKQKRRTRGKQNLAVREGYQRLERMNGVHTEPEVYTTKEMCFYCFDVLKFELSNRSLTTKEKTVVKKKRRSTAEEPNPEDYSIPNFDW